ncbi:unnamed protein product [Porites evermanni]|uniref:Synaptosomal-associated protein n=1 Tax=Porites evermanni TaxID=104178 RepID=A0ABN8M7D4_9CNID|nr:unnamed protein product [Porites evermanni]
MSDEDRMRSEIARMQMRGDELTDQNFGSSKRLFQVNEISQEVGIRTLVALDEQGEQLDRVEENLDQINADMKEAERNLTSLEKCCGLCVCPWRRRKNFEKTENYKRAFKSNDDGVVSRQPVVAHNVFGDLTRFHGSSGGLKMVTSSMETGIKDKKLQFKLQSILRDLDLKITNILQKLLTSWTQHDKTLQETFTFTDKSVRYQQDGNRGETPKTGYIQKITGDAREDEMDENLGQVSNIVGNLKSMAIDMGNEIETQNRQLDRINAKAEANDVRIQLANSTTEDILRNI